MQQMLVHVGLYQCSYRYGYKYTHATALAHSEAYMVVHIYPIYKYITTRPIHTQPWLALPQTQLPPTVSAQFTLRKRWKLFYR